MIGKRGYANRRRASAPSTPFRQTIALLAITLSIASMSVFALARAEQSRGAIIGRVIDAQTSEALSQTAVLLLELNLSTIAHEDGHFSFPKVSAGSYSIKTIRIGYQSVVQTVTVERDETSHVTIRLRASPLVGEGVVVVGEGVENSQGTVRPTDVVSGRRLQRQLGRTLAETVGHEPGMSQRTMGPAPARPVIRGFGGDRLLILEDGNRTGDISATAPDHAVVVDPITSERIEVVRGPGALVYSSSPLGGVINVVRGQIPSFPSEHLHGTLSVQGESVNKGRTGGSALTGPIGPLILRLDGNIRRASDITTPVGSLLNTAISTYNTSLGGSFLLPTGYVGAAGSYYQSEYGIPGGFVGAHPKGVNIKIDKVHGEGKAELFPLDSWLYRAETQASVTRYHHREFESSGILGVEIGLLTYNVSSTFHHKPIGPFQKGLFGVWGEYRDYSSGGFSFTVPTRELSVAGFTHEEFSLEDLTIQAALRYDIRLVNPRQQFFSSRIGSIRKRTFNDISAGISATCNVGSGFFVGSNIIRTFRSPTIEELFSEGPHLAAYSYEIGNPDLHRENGWGAELFTDYSSDHGSVRAAVFGNDIESFIFPRNTGKINFRTLLPEYQFSEHGVLMYGAEMRMEWNLVSGLVTAISASYVRGELRGTGKPLPMIPPLSTRTDLRYTLDAWTFGITALAADRQTRVGEFEQPTAGYVRYDGYIQFQKPTANFLHTVVLSAENITNNEYRMHLSRVKSIMPEPARNMKLLYRVYF
jgi:iron complex outermembrane receptor protein